jgi:5S rRNA maturation endonuclease (ribonuclease M5)
VGTSDPQELLTPYIAGDTFRENGDIDAHCPLPNHAGGVDRKRSAVLNFEEGVYYCNGCGVGGTLDDLMAIKDQWNPPPDGFENKATVRRRAARTTELPTAADVERWKRALADDPVLMDDLKNARGLWTKTLDVFQVGWDKKELAYTFPIFDSKGALVNVRWYQIRPPKGRRKIWGVTGHNAPRLYPATALLKAKRDPGKSIIICEGELDAIICNQYNFRAITKTNGAKVWRPGWNDLFKDLTVYVCHDMDHDGQTANRKIARSLTRSGVNVLVLKLPYAVTKDHGKDITDWWLEHDADRDAFQRLLDEARPFDEASVEDPQEVDPNPAAVVDAFDARRVGRPLALTVTVKGRREPGYSVPRKIEYRCTRDAGKPCMVCPLYDAEPEPGEADAVIAGADPRLLEFLDATRPQVSELLRKIKGIPKCPKININVTEHQAVEILYARPSVEHSNGSNSDYKNITLTSVGRHDTAPNQTVRVVGALHPDPRRQSNAFLTWDVSRMETSLDRFEMTSDIHEDLQRFQPKLGQKPLHKLREISNDLADHVTHIYGRPTLHAAVDLVYHSVIGFAFDGKPLDRGWMEILVVGDTRAGKSETGKLLRNFYGAGEVVLCEAATYAGIIGGAQQFGGNKEWAITWGAIPLNDRRLVILDEISALTVEEISQMSGVRSSGVAELTKIQQERTHARTRLIWMGNPRSAAMKDFTYGVQAIKPLIGSPEDIARFDLALSVSSGDVPSSEINRPREVGPQQFPQASARNLLRWVWSRSPEHVVWDQGATQAVYEAAETLGGRYVEDPPLIQAANVREKVARIAVALAARLFSTDARGESIIVKRAHVQAAVSFINVLYTNPDFGYGERSREIIEDRRAAENNAALIKRYLQNKPGLARFLRSNGQFRRQDLEEVLDIDREEANAIISQLYELRAVYKLKGDVKLQPTLHKLLREVP